MTPTKNLGIWMDHASANLMEFTNEPIETKTVESAFTHEEKADVMHNKEQQQQSAFYKKIGESIKNYDEVILFGPTDAKQELFNLLKADHHFDKIKIEVKQSDKMTENQQHAFVKDYFKQN
jgi:stalled ribosome rescue protein Dom34